MVSIFSVWRGAFFMFYGRPCFELHVLAEFGCVILTLLVDLCAFSRFASGIMHPPRPLVCACVSEADDCLAAHTCCNLDNTAGVGGQWSQCGLTHLLYQGPSYRRFGSRRIFS